MTYEEKARKYADSQVNIGTQRLCRIEGFIEGYNEALNDVLQWLCASKPGNELEKVFVEHFREDRPTSPITSDCSTIVAQKEN